MPSLNGLGAILANGGGLMRKNPATAVDSEVYETFANHPDENTYDENPHDRTEWADEDERVY